VVTRILNILRWFKWTLLRLHDATIGPRKAELDRLIKAGRVKIGPHTYAYGNPRIKTFDYDNTCIEIGDYGSLSADSIIMLGGKHAVEALTTYPHRILWNMEGAGQDGFPVPTGDSFIGADVWLCDGAIVLSGLRIGHGAIIAAGAIVTKDVPDYAIVGGNPARLIAYRFPEEQRKALVEIAWWDWPEEEVRKAVPLLAGKDADAFIAYAREQGRYDGPVPAPAAASDTPVASGMAQGARS